jgi:hypothetical protein
MGMTVAMNEDQTQNENPGRAPSEPEQNPMEHPAPPGNPEIDEDRLKEAEEGLDEVVGR